MIDIKHKLDLGEEYHIFIFGDSHAKCFYLDKYLNLDNININNSPLSSASMKGLSNPTSKLNHKNQIITSLKSLNILNSTNICVLKFGQVDIEYNYYHKIYKKNENLIKDEFYNNLIEDYITFIKNLQETYPQITFIVNGVNMPNLYDIQNYIKPSTPLAPHIPYDDQFSNHLLFNSKLKNSCENNKISYFDLTKETTIGNKIKPEFKGNDNHFSGAEWYGGGVKKNYNYNTYNTFINKLFKTIPYGNQNNEV